MGNSLSTSVTARPGGALDAYISELGGGVVYEKSMGTARFLKTVKGRHKNGPVVVKIFIKPDPGLSLRLYNKRLKAEREALADLPNVYGYQTFAETERAGYLIRQWVASNLYDRISTRPFLSAIEKKWIAYQILTGMRDARNRNIAHGDLKSENILVTSWNWILLTDFSSFKPVHLPEDDPSDFAFYFDTSGRRTCYLAPERFRAGKGREREAKVSEAMDVFAAGCVLAEMFLDGSQVFTLSQLFKYRSGELALDSHLAAIEDEGVKTLIKRMMSLNPSLRPTFDEALTDSRDLVFPESFYTFYHHYICSLNEPAASPFHPTSADQQQPEPPTTAAQKTEARLPSDADHRLDRLWEEWESIERHLGVEGEGAVRNGNGDGAGERGLGTYQRAFPVVVQIPNVHRDFPPGPSSARQAAADDGPALIILSVVCANLRNCSRASSKVRALDLLLALAPHLTDEAKLDRLVPYVVDMLHEESALVRAAALRTLLQTLMLVQAITPSNAAIFPEYIFPNVRDLAHDSDVSVRCMYAQCMVALAETGVRYLEMDQALKAHGTFKLAEVQDEDAPQERSYDASLQDIQTVIQEELVALLVDPSSAVKRAMLQNIASLCVFFGRQKTNDVLLSHMITFLNDRDWLLRYAFFDSIVGVAVCVGARCLEEYILPLMIQSLSDTEEAIVARVLSALTSLSDLGLFAKMRIWELMSATIGFLYHPNVWIREGAAAFLSSAAKHLPVIDVWSILYPSLRPLLRADVAQIDEFAVLSTMKTPLARQVFDAAITWAARKDKSQFWKAAGKDARSRVESGKDALRKAAIASSRALAPRSEEDEGQITKLQQLGMTSSDEAKLLALSDYILKLAAASGSFLTRSRAESESVQLLQGVDVQLQQLGVRPTTVFLGSRTPDPNVRTEYQRRITSDAGLQKSVSMQSSLRLPRSPAGSNRPNSPLPGDPRRKAIMEASSTSLNVTPPSTRLERQNSSVSLQSQATDTVVNSTKPSPRPDAAAASPVGSQFSVSTDPAGLRRLRGLPGTSDAFKALPAVGSSNTTAVGHLEAPIQLRADDDITPSGRSSPVSTARPDSRLKFHTAALNAAWGGQDPGINHIIEHFFHDSFREAVPELGPRINNGPVRRRSAARASFPPQGTTGRRSEVTLVAHLTTHTGAINGLAVSPDHTFFVSCSNDKTVQVWDTSRLSNNVTSKPRHVYVQHHARVTCVCMIEASHCFASAGDDGSLHVVRVHVGQSGSQPRYGKLQLIREHQVEASGEYISCLAHFNSETSSNLVYATTRGNVVVLDVRTMRTVLHMVNPGHFGPISCMCLDRRRAWLVTGTLGGVLTLWDLRFGLCLRSWRVAASAINPSSPPAIHQCVPHPTKGRDKWIVVAVESRFTRAGDEAPVRSVTLEVWDVDKANLVETFVHSQEAPDGGPPDTPRPAAPQTKAQEAERSAAMAIEEFVRSRRGGVDRSKPKITNDGAHVPQPAIAHPIGNSWISPDVRALLIGVDFGGFGALAQASAGVVEEEIVHRANQSALYGGGQRSKESKGFVIAGCEDRKVRYWDLGRVAKSFVVSGSSIDGEKPIFGSLEPGTYLEAWTNRPPPSARDDQRHGVIGLHQQQLLRAHQDCVTALACIDSPFRGGIISGDRAGVIKVFRVDFS